MEQVNVNNLKFRSGDSGVKYIFRGPNMEWGIIVFKPSESLGKHFHNQVEETFYLEEGEAKMIINDKEINAISGDVFKLAPKDTHDIINQSNKNIDLSSLKLLIFLMIKLVFKS